MAESLSQVYIHIVFSTKRREKLILKKYQNELHRYIAQIVRNKGCVCFRVGGVSDHVHIACAFPRTLTIADLVRDIKNNSSRWLSKRCGYFQWQDGYAVFSVSPSHLEALVKYIDNQEQHHRAYSIEDEINTLHDKYKLPSYMAS